ncbi:hypothetical protein ACH492_08925 [Streptomyces sp. NPDC019443]|uniref:hypothetical protein n=1 Tax=Streptomyces sp. NPDC019443 TaxID=3365061 RepID=UPI0037A3ADF6
MNLGPIPLNKRLVAVLVSWQLGVLLAVATAVLGPLIAISHGDAKGWLVGGLAFVAAITALTVAVRGGKMRGYKWFARQVYQRVCGSGVPVLDDLKSFCAITDKASINGELGRLRRSVLDTAINVCGSPSLEAQRRAVIYEFRAGSPDLILTEFKGRPHLGAPRPRFSAAHPEDGNVVTWCEGVRKGGRPLVDHSPDAKSNSRGHVGSLAHYESYMSAPVYTNMSDGTDPQLGTTYGLLGIDATDSNDLVEEDKQSMIMLASILAAGYAHRAAVLGFPASIATQSNSRESGQ